jgi:hypothetical protein
LGTSRRKQSNIEPRYARMIKQAEVLIAATYLAGTNTRRVKRALAALFKGAVGDFVGIRMLGIRRDGQKVLLAVNNMR